MRAHLHSFFFPHLLQQIFSFYVRIGALLGSLACLIEPSCIWSQRSHCAASFSPLPVRTPPHNVIQQDTVYILLVLCWPDSEAVILIMVYICLALDVSHGSGASFLCCRFIGRLLLFLFLWQACFFAGWELLLCLTRRLPSVNSVCVSLRHPHTLCLWSNTLRSVFFCGTKIGGCQTAE